MSAVAAGNRYGTLVVDLVFLGQPDKKKLFAALISMNTALYRLNDSSQQVRADPSESQELRNVAPITPTHPAWLSAFPSLSQVVTSTTGWYWCGNRRLLSSRRATSPNTLPARGTALPNGACDP